MRSAALTGKHDANASVLRGLRSTRITAAIAGVLACDYRSVIRRLVWRGGPYAQRGRQKGPLCMAGLTGRSSFGRVARLRPSHFGNLRLNRERRLERRRVFEREPRPVSVQRPRLPDEGRTHRRSRGAWRVAGVGLELRLLYDRELRRSQVYRLAPMVPLSITPVGTGSTPRAMPMTLTGVWHALASCPSARCCIVLRLCPSLSKPRPPSGTSQYRLAARRGETSRGLLIVRTTSAELVGVWDVETLSGQEDGKCEGVRLVARRSGRINLVARDADHASGARRAPRVHGQSPRRSHRI